MDIYTVYYIDLTKFNYVPILKKLNKMGFLENELNDLFFSPFLIIHKDFKNPNIYIYENINDGYLKLISTKAIIIEDKSEEEFLTHAHNLIYNSLDKTALF